MTRSSQIDHEALVYRFLNTPLEELQREMNVAPNEDDLVMSKLEINL